MGVVVNGINVYCGYGLNDFLFILILGFGLFFYLYLRKYFFCNEWILDGFNFCM